MKRLFLFSILSIVVFSCGKEALDLTISGEVRGLKKGTLYLERLVDTNLVSIDSSVIIGNPQFQFNLSLEEPEVLYLSLDANSDDEPRIAFFADSGAITINTSLKRFFHDAKISGTEEQALWDQYKAMITNFNNKELDLLKSGIEHAQDSVYVDSIDNLRQRNLVRRYQYTVNFAKTNSSSALAPFLLISEIPDANVSYLDTVYKSLTEDVLNSKYGQQLKELIEKKN